MKPTVYIETTIPSYLTAWPSRDLVRMAHQQITIDWWAKRDYFEIYSSRLVVRECQAGDPTAAAARIACLAGIPLLDQDREATTLAEELVRNGPLPPKAAADALHIAIAAVNGMEYLLTWNCTHIANAQFQRGFQAICLDLNYKPPLICTPDLLSPDGYPDV